MTTETNNRANDADRASEPSAKDILAQLDRILASPDFGRAGRMKRFLQFIVEETLAEHSQALKEYTIAVEVFERDESFDPTTNSLVRVEAGRLRRTLKQYYLTHGSADEVTIEVPRGGYIPRFIAGTRPARERDVSVQATAPVERAEESAPTLGDTPLSDKPSIAVLPFDNLSDDPQQEYFSDGMAEDLITDISKISGLFVIARNSSFAFKGQSVDVETIAEQLGVKHILEGSVRKMGDKVRINAQLIDAASGGHIWAERYDDDMENIFECQDDIRKQIVYALRVSLTPTDKALTERKPTDNAEAYDLYLKGRANYHRNTHEDLPEAIKCLEEAIEIDPNFADAYGYLSFCHFRGWHEMLPGFDNNLDRANELAERGVVLDGTSAIALTRLGWIQAFLRRYDQAIANLEKAIALAPNNAEVYATFGIALNYWGDPEKGLEMLEKAFSLDTFVPPIREYQVGHSHLLLRQYDEAITRLNRMVERAPKFIFAYVFLACAYIGLDRLDDARDAIKTVLEISPQYTVKDAAKVLPYRIDEVRNRIVDGLRKAGLPEG